MYYICVYKNDKQMEILKNIESAVRNATTLAKVNAEITVTNSFIDLDVQTIEEAKKLEIAFKRSFSEVEILDLSEIGETGYTLTVRF